MKKYAFIGTYDKTDMLIYIARILCLLGKKVLLVDTTVLKKSRYIVPTMFQDKQYITTYEEIDVAIGFDSFEAIKKYQIETVGKETEYDIALLDIDRAIAYDKFKIQGEDKHYFVTSFDIFNLKRGIQVLAHLQPKIKVTKIYYTKNMLQEEDELLNFLTKNYKIHWNKNIIFFPFETSDLDIIYTNQRSGKIQMKGLSNEYVDAILYLAEEISEENSAKVRKAYKNLEN